MTAPIISGRWRHHATLRSRGHVSRVWRRDATPTCQIPTYVVELNGAPRRVLGNWREAMAYAANLLTITIQHNRGN